MNDALAPIIFLKIECDDGTILQFREPLVLHPRRIKNLGTNMLLVENPDLGIAVYDETRDQLIKDIEIDIEVLWSEFAEEDDANLTIGSQGLKQRLLAAIEKIN